MLKIDVFPHIIPPKFAEALYARSSAKPLSKGYGTDQAESLYNIEKRLRIMEHYEGYVQILNIAIPPVEDVAKPELAVELAKIANDEMAELVAKYPDKFVAAVACLPMNDVDACLKEVDRAILDLRFRGVQVTSNIMDKPIDSPEFEPLFEKMNYYKLPIIIHPRTILNGPRAFSRSREPQFALQDETGYWAQIPFNWPFETTLAMGRLVYSGILDKYPDLIIVTHHCGGFLPYQAERIMGGLDVSEMRVGLKPSRYFSKRIIDYYKMMYGDTACYGNTPALMCGLAFFGIDHILFGTDMPFDSQGGERYTRETIRSVEEMDITPEDRKKIFESNAKKLFRLPL